MARKSQALISWLNSVQKGSKDVSRLDELAGGEHFIDILKVMEPSDEVVRLNTPRDRFNHLKSFLDNFLQDETKNIIDYDAIIRAKNDYEISKVLLLVLYVCVNSAQNSTFVSPIQGALPVRHQWVIKDLLKIMDSCHRKGDPLTTDMFRGLDYPKLVADSGSNDCAGVVSTVVNSRSGMENGSTIQGRPACAKNGSVMKENYPGRDTQPLFKTQTRGGDFDVVNWKGIVDAMDTENAELRKLYDEKCQEMCDETRRLRHDLMEKEYLIDELKYSQDKNEKDHKDLEVRYRAQILENRELRHQAMTPAVETADISVQFDSEEASPQRDVVMRCPTCLASSYDTQVLEQAEEQDDDLQLLRADAQTNTSLALEDPAVIEILNENEEVIVYQRGQIEKQAEIIKELQTHLKNAAKENSARLEENEYPLSQELLEADGPQPTIQPMILIEMENDDLKQTNSKLKENIEVLKLDNRIREGESNMQRNEIQEWETAYQHLSNIVHMLTGKMSTLTDTTLSSLHTNPKVVSEESVTRKMRSVAYDICSMVKVRDEALAATSQYTADMRRVNARLKNLVKKNELHTQLGRKKTELIMEQQRLLELIGEANSLLLA